jgi:hypothetical protein
MVKKLHKEGQEKYLPILNKILLVLLGEFNEYCLPNRDRALLKIDIPIENQIFKLTDELFETKSDSSFELFPKQV